VCEQIRIVIRGNILGFGRSIFRQVLIKFILLTTLIIISFNVQSSEQETMTKKQEEELAIEDVSVELTLSDIDHKVFYDSPYAESADRQLILRVINDFFSPIGISTDENLTNSVKIGWITKKLPEFLKWYHEDDAQEYYAVTLSQDIYTPEDLESEEVVEDDRPYAGWLYLTFTIAKRVDRVLNISIADIGVVGPASQADHVQINFHKHIDSTDPKGWDNQLRNEIGINLKHMHARGARIEKDFIDVDLVGYAGGSIGNVDTSVLGGVVIRAGYNVPDDMMLGYYEKDDINIKDSVSFYLMASAQSSYHIQDIFLDGNTFRDSHSVDKHNWVNQFSLGLTARYKNFSLTYQVSKTSEQFRLQDDDHFTGTWYLSYHVKF
jgi:lipid A 3-O-deacylase